MDENARVQAKLELMKFHQEQLKLQRGTMDTWFKYYLLIVGGPLAVLGATANSGGSGGGLPLENLQLWSTVALLLFAVGFIFLAMHTAQRYNSLKQLRDIATLRGSLPSWLRGGLDEDIPPRPFGADFWVALLFSLLGSFWLAAGCCLRCSALSCLLPECKPAGCRIVFDGTYLLWPGLVAFGLQLLIRFAFLWKAERTGEYFRMRWQELAQALRRRPRNGNP